MPDIKELHSELHRQTVNFIPKAGDAVERAAKRECLNKTDTINRAALLYDFVSEIMAADGKVLVREAGSEETLIVRLF